MTNNNREKKKAPRPSSPPPGLPANGGDRQTRTGTCARRGEISTVQPYSPLKALIARASVNVPGRSRRFDDLNPIVVS